MDILEPTFASSSVNSDDASKAVSFSEQIVSLAGVEPAKLSNLIADSSFISTLAQCLTADQCEEKLVANMKLIRTIFPLMTPEKQNELIDEGLFITSMDLIQTENLKVLIAVLEFIAATASVSDYACDSMFSFGYHQNLMDIAEHHSQREDPTEKQVTVRAAIGLFRLYGCQNRILSKILVESIQRMFHLLELRNLSNNAISYILKTITEVTNQNCSLSYVLFNGGIVPHIVEFLDTPELVPATLPLLGNLCLSSRENVEELKKLGVPKKLLSLLKSDNAADAFWAISNMMESAPDVISNLILTDEKLQKFTTKVLDIADKGNPDIQREAIFNLATFIIFSSRNNVPHFLNARVISHLIVLLNCNQPPCVSRILDVFARFGAHAVGSQEEAAKLFGLIENTHFIEKITELTEDPDSVTSTKAHEVLEQYNALQTK